MYNIRSEGGHDYAMNEKFDMMAQRHRTVNHTQMVPFVDLHLTTPRVKCHSLEGQPVHYSAQILIESLSRKVQTLRLYLFQDRHLHITSISRSRHPVCITNQVRTA